MDCPICKRRTKYIEMVKHWNQKSGGITVVKYWCIGGKHGLIVDPEYHDETCVHEV